MQTKNMQNLTYHSHFFLRVYFLGCLRGFVIFMNFIESMELDDCGLWSEPTFY